MLKRTIIITTPCRLNIRNAQLLIENETGTVSTVPVEDLGNVIIENQQTHITLPAMNTLIGQNVCVTICDRKSMPSGMLFPLEGNSLQGERYRLQVEASLPVKKSLWKQIIESKIRNQSILLDKSGLDGEPLKPYYRNVKSGDSDNREGVAASFYWKELFGHEFLRDRNGASPNNLLNYGYAILRAATARAIVSAGLLPSLGIHHKSRYNAFPLADDLMEPFRPWVDETVLSLTRESCHDLTRETKNRLVNVVYADACVEGRRHPLSIAMTLLCASVVAVMNGEQTKLRTPELI